MLKQALAPYSKDKGLRVVCVLKWDEETVRALNPDILIVMTTPYGLINFPQPPHSSSAMKTTRWPKKVYVRFFLGEWKPLENFQ